MALTKVKKHELVSEVSQLLDSSRMTVVAQYQGTTVKAIQDLRRQARDNGTSIKVIKNRLVIKALQANDNLKDADTSGLTGMLLYAFNDQDEVAPAQVLAKFAKAHPTIQFVGAYTGEGTFMDAAQVQALSALPSKNQLIAGLINTLNGPVNGVMSGLAGNLHGLLDAVAARAAA